MNPSGLHTTSPASSGLGVFPLPMESEQTEVDSGVITFSWVGVKALLGAKIVRLALAMSGGFGSSRAALQLDELR
jgi:hypothetical protein